MGNHLLLLYTAAMPKNRPVAPSRKTKPPVTSDIDLRDVVLGGKTCEIHSPDQRIKQWLARPHAPTTASIFQGIDGSMSWRIFSNRNPEKRKALIFCPSKQRPSLFLGARAVRLQAMGINKRRDWDTFSEKTALRLLQEAHRE